MFACKTIVYDGKSRSERLAKREFEILARLNSPNIVRYVDAQWEPRQAKLYMEMCEARSLDQLIGQYARFCIKMPSEHPSWLYDMIIDTDAVTEGEPGSRRTTCGPSFINYPTLCLTAIMGGSPRLKIAIVPAQNGQPQSYTEI